MISSGSVPEICWVGAGGGAPGPGDGVAGRGRERRKNIARPPPPGLPLAGDLPAVGLPWAGLVRAGRGPALRRAVNTSATSLVRAMVSASATTMIPSTWAVAADMFSDSVKVPASGEPVSATGLPVVPVTGVGTTATGVIVGRSLATLCGVSSEVAAGVGGSTTGGITVGSVAVLTGLTAATGLKAGAVPDGDGDGFLLGDGLAEAVPVTRPSRPRRAGPPWPG